jgi:hypothetical protein
MEGRLYRARGHQSTAHPARGHQSTLADPRIATTAAMEICAVSALAPAQILVLPAGRFMAAVLPPARNPAPCLEWPVLSVVLSLFSWHNEIINVWMYVSTAGSPRLIS